MGLDTQTQTSVAAAFTDATDAADVDVVMADAADLVTVDHTLRQILNVKGD